MEQPSRPALAFWFSIGSTYTYLTALRIVALAQAEGVDIVWRPFSVRTLMVEQDNVPFRGKPIKTAYMWRDIERRAVNYALPVRVPAPYPLSQWDLVNRIAILAAAEGWCETYVVETYRRWFQLSQEPGVEPQLGEMLTAIGQDPSRVRAAAISLDNLAAYETATDEARSLNVFGSPSFVVEGEIFWGDDRLEDAMGWAKGDWV